MGPNAAWSPAFGSVFVNKTSVAKFRIGQVIRHRLYACRGVVFDVDPEFREFSRGAMLVEGWHHRDQPFYLLFAENDDNPHVAYIAEQNLQADSSDEPVHHPEVADLFERDEDGAYLRRDATLN